jgi:short-subunit dehydrogenase
MCQLVLPGMRRQRYGRIVNLSSMGGRVTFPGGGFYHGTKYAVEAISDALRFEVRGFGVDVVLIEPGLIKTEFGDTVAKEMGEDDGDYAEFNRAVSEGTVAAYQGPMMRLGGGPEAVAKKIEKAISARRPKTRYPVTASARLVLMQKALLPDRGWDRAVGTQFPKPGKS